MANLRIRLKFRIRLRIRLKFILAEQKQHGVETKPKTIKLYVQIESIFTITDDNKTSFCIYGVDVRYLNGFLLTTQLPQTDRKTDRGTWSFV